MLDGEIQRNGTTKRMADETCTLDRKGIQRCDYGSCEVGNAAALHLPSRVAVTGQIDGMNGSIDRQLQLIEHPAVEVAAEAMDQNERHCVSRSGGQDIDQMAARGDRAWQWTLARLFGRSSRRHALSRDEIVDLVVGYPGIGNDAEKRADRDGDALFDQLPSHDTRRWCAHDIGDLGGLDLEQILAGLDRLTVGGQPADELAFSHRHAPPWHGNGMNALAHHQSSMTFLTA